MSALEDITHIKERLARNNYFPGTSGNLGIRIDENSLYVTTSGVDKYETTDSSFVKVDMKGHAIDTDLVPSLETVLHLKVFTQSAANASIHIHTVANNVISELYGKQGYVEFSNQELIKAFGLWQESDVLRIPIIENPADVTVLAELFGKHVNHDSGVVLIRNHGLNAWGKSTQEAYKLFEAAEFLFQYHLQLAAAKQYIH
ncbi:methylthioribulose 1-phosphate dehydratase [Macrococcus equi]|uniref:methylthioribulose 1-phosphate dehydratase n=1 Tax=Macrococcus equi TaxID=3395462 RepID=UPI0039BDDB2A